MALAGREVRRPRRRSRRVSGLTWPPASPPSASTRLVQSVASELSASRLALPRHAGATTWPWSRS